MGRFVATLLDAYRLQRKQENPHYQVSHPKPAGEALVGATKQPLPHLDLLADPIGHWGNALQDFHNWQLHSGFELLKAGMAPQTAAELQNVMLAGEHRDVGIGPTLQTPYFVAPPLVEPRPIEPWHDQLTTVPGAPNPLMPGG